MPVAFVLWAMLVLFVTDVVGRFFLVELLLRKVSLMTQAIQDLANAVAGDASLANLRSGVEAAVAKIASLEAENANLRAQLAAMPTGMVTNAEIALEEENAMLRRQLAAAYSTLDELERRIAAATDATPAPPTLPDTPAPVAPVAGA